MSEKEFPDWEAMYQQDDVESMPWFQPELDHDVAGALEVLGVDGGRVLDLGTGAGTQAIALAERGFDVTGTDLSAAAVEKAQARAEKAGVAVRFLQDDVLASRVDGEFDLVVDRGVLHVLPPAQRGVYVETVRGLLAVGGYLLVKCFSRDEPGDEGPYRFGAEELRGLFETQLQVLAVGASEFRAVHQPPPKAVFGVMRRR